MAQRIQIFNSRRSGKKTKGKRKKGSRRNAGGLSFLFNGKGANMSKKRKSRGKRKPNPFRSRRTKGFRKGRGNPSLAKSSREGTMNVLIEGGSGALASGLGSHLISEFFLSQFNSGITSYLITAAIGGGIAWAGGKFIGKRFFYGGLAGTVLAVGYRVVEDMGATPAKAVSADVRDAQAAQASSGGGAPAVSGMGRRGVRGLGTIVPFPFNVPQSYQVVNGQLVPVGQQLPPAAGGNGQPAGGMSGLGRTRPIARRQRY